VTGAVRYCLIGCGGDIAEEHLSALSQLDVELHAMADLDAASGSAVAQEYGARFFQDYREMLAEMSPDVAVIATPHPSHAEIAIECMQAGAHVLVEKPLAIEVAEADAMIETAARTKRLLGVCFQFRFRPAIEEAHRLVSEGTLGRLLRVSCREAMLRTTAYYRSATWRGTWAGEGGGVLLNQAPHALDLLCYLAGAPARVCGWTRNLMHDIEVEDTALALIGFASGAVGELIVTTADPAPLRIELVGERGRLEVRELELEVEVWEPDLATYVATSAEFFDPPESRRRSIALPPGEGDHLDVHRDFLAAVREGRTPRASGRDALLSLELANAIILSGSDGGSPLDLPIDRNRYADLLAGRRAGR
jgi:predicted dehydrogenase